MFLERDFKSRKSLLQSVSFLTPPWDEDDVAEDARVMAMPEWEEL